MTTRRAPLPAFSAVAEGKATLRFTGPDSRDNRDAYLCALNELSPGSYTVDDLRFGVGAMAVLTLVDETRFLAAVQAIRWS